MSQLDKPNWIAPLAASYNERGVDGYAATVTNGKDQRKINCYYDVASNSQSGSRKLYLCKRPGIATSSATNGVTGQRPYLIMSSLGNSRRYIFSHIGGGTNEVVSTQPGSSSTNTVVSSSTERPSYCDKMLISGAEVPLVQTDDTSSNAKKAYWLNGSSWTLINDADFPTPIGKMELMDGYAFALQGLTNRIFNSDLNTFSAWTATSFITKQIQLDPPVSLAKLGRVILAFGEETVEGFYNAGNTTGSPLGRIPSLASRVGMAQNSERAVFTQLGSRLFFIGSERSSAGQVPPENLSCSLYMFDGSRFEKVSTNFIDKIISDNHVYSVCAVSYRGYYGIAVNLSDVSDSPQRALIFFPSLNEWFEWTSTVWQITNDGTYFLPIASGSGGNILGDQMSNDVWVDGTATAYTMTHQFKIPQNGSQLKRMPMFGVVGDTQTGTSGLLVEKSDNDYVSFQTLGTIDMTKEKKNLYRCGAFRGRAMRLSHSDNTDCRLELAVARIED